MPAARRLMFQKILTSTLWLFLFFGAQAQNATDFAGTWRGEFALRPGITVPFNFEITKNGTVFLLNAEEKFETGKISLSKDSLFIPLDQFDNELAFIARRNKLVGVLRKQDHSAILLPVVAEKNSRKRFGQNKSLSFKNIAGTYDLEFTFESGKTEKSVAVFSQKGKQLTGTFLKESGDSRFLQGITEGDTFYLSSFIGSTPGYYTGRVNDDGTISGEQIGSRVRHAFKGKRDDHAALPDPYKESADTARQVMQPFSFPDVEGKMVSLSDEKYKGKVIIIPITGTWCPNCIDEAAFLSPWFKENQERGVEIITIHYERQADTAYYRKVMNRFRKRFNIQYDQIFGGMASSDTVRSSLKLPAFSAFPTTIFIDKKGRIAKKHSGYSGPATGKFYDDFIKEFNSEVNKLLKE